MTDNIVLIDFNNIFYRMLYAHKHLSYGTKSTGGIYGFLNHITQLINFYNPAYIACFNDKYPLKRQYIYPEYKAKRHSKERDENFYKVIIENRAYIVSLLSRLGIPLIEVEGYEADDLIAANANYNYDDFEVIISSNDDDLYFLLDKNVIFHKSKEYSYEHFKADYPDLEPKDWHLFKTLTGNHNEVKPLFKGCGPKRALKILANEEELTKVWKEHTTQWTLNYILTEYPVDFMLTYDDVYKPMAKFTKRRELENILMRDFGIQITSNIENAFNYLEAL